MQTTSNLEEKSGVEPEVENRLNAAHHTEQSTSGRQGQGEAEQAAARIHWYSVPLSPAWFLCCSVWDISSGWGSCSTGVQD